MSPQRWIESTNSAGIILKSGRYGGTVNSGDVSEYTTTNTNALSLAVTLTDHRVDVNRRRKRIDRARPTLKKTFDF